MDVGEPIGSAAQPEQMQALCRSGSGSRVSSPAGMSVLKHQQGALGSCSMPQ